MTFLRTGGEAAAYKFLDNHVSSGLISCSFMIATHLSRRHRGMLVVHIPMTQIG